MARCGAEPDPERGGSASRSPDLARPRARLARAALRSGPGRHHHRQPGGRRRAAMYDDQPEAAGTASPADERSHARVLREVTRGMEGGVARAVRGSAPGRRRQRAAGGGAGRQRRAGEQLQPGDGRRRRGQLGQRHPDRRLCRTPRGRALDGAGGVAERPERPRAIREPDRRRGGRDRGDPRRRRKRSFGSSTRPRASGPEQARQLAHRLVTGDRRSRPTPCSREELGIDPDELGGSPWVAAGTSFVLFAIGALIPLLPFLFLRGLAGIAVSPPSPGSRCSLFGAAITIVTGRHAPWRGSAGSSPSGWPPPR